MKILVTGGAGFIGSSFLVKYVPLHSEHQYLNIDKLSYASNLKSLESIENSANYAFQRVDLTEADKVQSLVSTFSPDLVIHFAAESHVDRSIHGPKAFMDSNILGTFHLLEACRQEWGTFEGKKFHHVSTDEVYGSLGDEGLFTETTPYDPSSPYSASKAASDHIVRAYHRTYGMPITITNCSNNYGPRQFPEKLIPLTILNCLDRKPLPIYGQGINVRDWLYVDDHCDAIQAVIEKGRTGETYNVGGNSEKRNIDVVKVICEEVALATGKEPQELLDLITFVKDRPGHDARYAIDATKIKTELGWEPSESFESGIRKTVNWYLDNTEWVESIKSGAYQSWLDTQYA